MKVVIDLQGAQGSNRLRGIGRYSLALAQAMARHAGGHDVWIALNGLFPDTIELVRAAFKDLVPPERMVVWEAPAPVADIDPANRWRREVGERLREAFLAELKPDVVHVSSLFEGLIDDTLTSIGRLDCGTPSAVTLYDLIPLVHRDPYLTNPTVESWYERKLTSLRRAGLALAISESSRRESIDWLSLPNDRVVNISAAANRMFRPVTLAAKDIERIRQQYKLPRPFAMYTGGIDHRKNIEGLINAYARVPIETRRAYQLAVVCSADESDINRLRQLAQKRGLSDDELVCTGFVPDADMVALYNLCTAFVFPSWHEGFGLPALEAMRCGAAVIGSNTSSIPEVIGRADALFDPHSEADIAAKLVQVLRDEAYREELKRHAAIQSRKFSWEVSATRALAALEDLVSRERGVKQLRRVAFPAHRPRLAYVSPLPPENTGIADYSAELLPQLARHYDIEVVVHQDEVSDPWIVANCPIRSVEWFEENANRFQRILYHFGNSAFHQHMFKLLEKHPGTVVLHDLFLSGVLAHMDFHGYAPGAWVGALYDSHGFGAVKERFKANDTADVVWKYPCSLGVLRHANGVIAHSGYSLETARKWYGARCVEDWVRIPHLRTSVVRVDRKSARSELGLRDDDFLVCSFGMLGPTKLNHRLLLAWISSPLMHDSRCHLVFVGENDGGRYGAVLLHAIDRHGSDRVRITGFASPGLYRTYLAAADAAVQLRTRSRGETSGTVLDCMNYGVPTIANAHGAAAELSGDIALVLPDQFTHMELQAALVKLQSDATLRTKMGEQARLRIRTDHDPWRIGNQYQEAIERFARSGPQAIKSRLVQRLADMEPSSEDDSLWAAAASAITVNHSSAIRPKQLLIDVSELLKRDDKSGIQRVVRSVLQELLTQPPDDYRVEPIYGSDDGVYRYARRFTLRFMGCPDLGLKDEPIHTGQGDIFLGLDLSPQIAPRCANALRKIRDRGAMVFFVVYDLLCVNRPDCFFAGAFDGFTCWLNHITQYADGAVCISRSVANELAEWLKHANVLRLRAFKIGWFHLGANIESSVPSVGASAEFDLVLKKLERNPNVLMVGTLEPRKGYKQALLAFERLWERGLEVNLVIVGKPGWMLDDLIDRIRQHPQAGKRLLWLESATDAMLQKLYETTDGLLLASEAEGFGLPLIEAAQHDLPILARDIPVFREIAGENATYFAGSLEEALDRWLGLLRNGHARKSAAMPWLTWAQSTETLVNMLRMSSHSNWLHKVELSTDVMETC